MNTTPWRHLVRLAPLVIAGSLLASACGGEPPPPSPTPAITSEAQPVADEATGVEVPEGGGSSLLPAFVVAGFSHTLTGAAHSDLAESCQESFGPLTAFSALVESVWRDPQQSLDSDSASHDGQAEIWDEFRVDFQAPDRWRTVVIDTNKVASDGGNEYDEQIVVGATSWSKSGGTWRLDDEQVAQYAAPEPIVADDICPLLDALYAVAGEPLERTLNGTPALGYELDGDAFFGLYEDAEIAEGLEDREDFFAGRLQSGRIEVWVDRETYIPLKLQYEENFFSVAILYDVVLSDINDPSIKIEPPEVP